VNPSQVGAGPRIPLGGPRTGARRLGTRLREERLRAAGEKVGMVAKRTSLYLALKPSWSGTRGKDIALGHFVARRARTVRANSGSYRGSWKHLTGTPQDRRPSPPTIRAAATCCPRERGERLSLAHSLRGTALAKSGNCRTALADFSAALAASPRDLIALIGNVSAHYLCGDLAAAARGYEARDKDVPTATGGLPRTLQRPCRAGRSGQRPGGKGSRQALRYRRLAGGASRAILNGSGSPAPSLRAEGGGHGWA
jgi:hypothetical protein